MEELHKLAKERKLDDLEAAWMARLESDNPPHDEMLAVAEYLVAQGEEDTASVLLWTLVNSAVESMGPKRAFPLARRAAERVPEDQQLREELANLYTIRYPEIEAMPKLVGRSGLTNGAPVGRACDTLDQWAGMTPGAYVCMRNSRRVARVERFDGEEGRCVIRDEDGERAMDLELAVQEVEVLPQDDLRALALFEKERVTEMAEQDPVGLVKLALSQAKDNALDFRSLKAKLIPGIIDTKAWSSWWNKAKPLLRKAPLIEMTAATQPKFTLREEAMAYEEEVVQRFQSARSAEKAMKIALEFAREAESGHAFAPEVVERLRSGLKGAAGAEPRHALGVASVLDQLAEAAEDAAARAEAEAAARAIEDLPAQLAALDDERIARRAAALIRRALPDACVDVFEAALERAPYRRCETLARELASSAPERLERAVSEIASAPDKYPEPFIWVWRSAARGGKRTQGLDREALTVSLLNLAQRLGRARAGEGEEEAKRLLALLRSVIAQNDYRDICGILGECGEETADQIKRNLATNRGLNEDVLHHLQKALQAAHPGLFHERVDPWEDASVIWTTHEGLRKRKEEYDHLVNVEALENSRAIGVAAARGDLSENAEWTAAVEEQKLIAERARNMEEDLRKARVILPEMASGERVNIGTRVKARDLETGEEAALEFLGPWDSDIASGKYSYKAPLSLAFMGKTVGDRVEAGEGEHRRRFEILGIESAV